MICTIIVHNGTAGTSGTTPTTFIGEDFYASDTHYIINYTSSIAVPVMSSPAWERWFDVWRLPVRPLIPNKCAIQQALRRAASRHCIKDARRWKRRRFVQRLQRVVVYTGAVN